MMKQQNEVQGKWHENQRKDHKEIKLAMEQWKNFFIVKKNGRVASKKIAEKARKFQ